MNKKILFLTFFLFAICSSFGFSQDDNFEDYQFDDDATSSAKQPYFALSVGGTASFLFMNYDDINKKLWNGVSYADNNEHNLTFDGPLVSWGFDFFTALSPLINNARLGISYQTGSKEKEVSDPPFQVVDTATSTITEIGINYFRKISVNTVGIHFDYAFIPIKSLAILPGVSVKFGTMSLEQYTTLTPSVWNEKKPPSFVKDPHNEKIEYSFMGIEPQLNIEYAFTAFLMFRLSASYLLTIDNPFYTNNWTINGNNSYSGVPSGVNPQGFSAYVGLYLGLFNY
jgi:hypothetical protein